MAAMSISVKDVHLRLGNNDVLNGVNLEIQDGERVAIVGPNGCGKSTLLRAISGILKPTSGNISLNGQPIERIHRRERARTLGLLNQSDAIPMMTTVYDNIAIGRHPYRSFLRDRSEADHAAVTKAIAKCELEHLRDRRVEALSGGERQRVRLATLLAQSPETLLLDEPLTGLDIEHQLALLHLLKDLNLDENRTIAVVLHDLATAIRFFERILVMHKGTVVADGPSGSILNSQVLKSVFGIDASIAYEQASGHPVLVSNRP